MALVLSCVHNIHCTLYGCWNKLCIGLEPDASPQDQTLRSRVRTVPKIKMDLSKLQDGLFKPLEPTTGQAWARQSSRQCGHLLSFTVAYYAHRHATYWRHYSTVWMLTNYTAQHFWHLPLDWLLPSYWPIYEHLYYEDGLRAFRRRRNPAICVQKGRAFS